MPYRAWLGLFWSLLVACGASDPDEQPVDRQAEQTANPTADETAGDDPSALQLTLTDEATPLSGGAQLQVREENPIVNLVITAVYEQNHDDLVQLQLALLGVETAMGVHRMELGPPGNSAAFAVAYLDAQSYSSSGGMLEVTLSGDGRIAGSVQAELFQDSQPGRLNESGEPFSLSGSFEGRWSLVCRSGVRGLPGDHSIADSPYCNRLQF
jgi:hypothetical protein